MGSCGCSQGMKDGKPCTCANCMKKRSYSRATGLRNINGDQFRGFIASNDKGGASAIANRVRLKGFNARVIPTSKGWTVYASNTPSRAYDRRMPGNSNRERFEWLKNQTMMGPARFMFSSDTMGFFQQKPSDFVIEPESGIVKDNMGNDREVWSARAPVFTRDDDEPTGRRMIDPMSDYWIDVDTLERVHVPTLSVFKDMASVRGAGPFDDIDWSQYERRLSEAEFNQGLRDMEAWVKKQDFQEVMETSLDRNTGEIEVLYTDFEPDEFGEGEERFKVFKMNISDINPELAIDAMRTERLDWIMKKPETRRRIRLPYSEVNMSMRVAGQLMLAEKLPDGSVQLYSDDGTKFSFPILASEAGWNMQEREYQKWVMDDKSGYWSYRPMKTEEGKEYMELKAFAVADEYGNVLVVQEDLDDAREVLKKLRDFEDNKDKTLSIQDITIDAVDGKWESFEMGERFRIFDRKMSNKFGSQYVSQLPGRTQAALRYRLKTRIAAEMGVNSSDPRVKQAVRDGMTSRVSDLYDTLGAMQVQRIIKMNDRSYDLALNGSIMPFASANDANNNGVHDKLEEDR
jgi:hypothetical protein